MSAATIGSSVLPWIAGYLFGRTSYHAVAWVIVGACIVLFTVHALLIRWQRQHPVLESTKLTDLPASRGVVIYPDATRTGAHP